MPSSACECSRLRKIVCRLAEETLRDPGAVADLELALGEALSNAVKYGGKDGKVSVRVGAHSGREVAVEMAYPDTQFDTKVTYPDDVWKGVGGFGRYIIQNTMDSMEYSFHDGLTTLKMTKRRTPRNRAS